MPSPEPAPRRFIFQDPLGHRWPRLRRVLVLWGAIVSLAIVWFIWSLLVKPELRLPLTLRQLKGQLRSVMQKPEPPPDDAKVLEPGELLKSRTIQDRLARAHPATPAPRKTHPGGIRLGFYVDFDPNAWQSFVEHGNSLTHVAPDWLQLVDTEGYLAFDPEPRLANLAAARGITVIPLLTNLAGDTWQPEAVENLARAGVDRRGRFITDLISKLRQAKAGGVIIHWEQLDPQFTDDYTSLIVQMAEALHLADLEIWLEVSTGEDFATFDLEALQLTVDQFVGDLYDESSESDPPGPIASLPWLQEWLRVMTQFGEPRQWVGVLGAYAYDWNTTTHHAEKITFKDAMTRASYAGVDQSPKPVMVAAKGYNGLYSYSETDGDHEVAFLDAISFYNQLRTLREWKLGGVGIERLGTGDPQIWDVLEAHDPLKGPGVKALETLASSDTVTHVGRGEVVSVDDASDEGRRIVTADPATGLLQAKYVDFPTYPTLFHQGSSGPHLVSITFDDGPDPVWTPKILDILRDHGLKACFFLVGKNAEAYPALVERIVREGHEIGNHTYNHANLAEMTPLRVQLELNMTQLVIESITGRSTTLFRPPYNADSNPSRLAEIIPLKLAKELNYIVVLEQIDPQDWARPGADAIVQRVQEQRGEGNIVLLHDAGGDRSQTVAALPRVIEYLQTRGDQIVPISTLINVPRDDLMPLLSRHQQTVQRMVASVGFRIWRALIEFFWSFMIFATGIVVARTLLVAWLAHRHYRALATAPPPPADYTPPVSVIIAAFNEGRVIAKTVRSVLETDYPGAVELLVVDDGSKDGTAAEVERLAATEPRLRLLRQPNAGKATALSRGVAGAQHEVLVFLDADTLFERGTLGALVAPLANPLVGAVSGNARVGNLRTFVARCQSLEYICGFNLDRRAYTVWDCITVVPGAVSSLRRTALEAAGGFSHDTLAEDTDLTLTLHRLHYRIEFAPGAVAWTEAPETFATLAKQRGRWAFGTMQCLWKHRDLVFNTDYGALGWFSLPNIWFFQIGLVAVTPVVDILLLWSIYFSVAIAIWWYFLIFLFLELSLSALACWMEGEPVRRAWISVPMRLIYRPLLAYVVWRSIFRALKGALVGWGKLERTASVPSRA